MPYGIYSFSYNGPCTNLGSKYSHHSGNYDYYDDYDLTCDVDASFEGAAKDLRSNFYDKFSENLIFDLNEKCEYSPNYLLGYYADVADVNPEIYVDNAKGEAQRELREMMLKEGKFRRYGCTYPHVPLDNPNCVYAMFPFWFLSNSCGFLFDLLS